MNFNAVSAKCFSKYYCHIKKMSKDIIANDLALRNSPSTKDIEILCKEIEFVGKTVCFKCVFISARRSYYYRQYKSMLVYINNIQMENIITLE